MRSVINISVKRIIQKRKKKNKYIFYLIQLTRNIIKGLSN